MADTLANVVTIVRDNIDEASAGYWPDAEIQRKIIRRYRELWSRIIAIRDDWFRAATPATLTLVAGTSRYTFAGMSVTDFFRVHAIRTTTSGREAVQWRWMSAKDPRFIEGLRADVSYTDPLIVYYDVEGVAAIHVSPLPRSALAAAVDYYTIPTDPTTTFGSIVDPFLRYVEAGATADCLAKGPVGDRGYWRDECDRAWAILLPLIGAPRSGQNNGHALSPFEVP